MRQLPQEAEMRCNQSDENVLSKYVKSLLCFGMLAACSVVCLCSDGASGWEQTAGPPGGRVNCVAVDIDEPDIVYAGLGELGIYRSTDGGTTWKPSGPHMGGWVGNITSTPTACSLLAAISEYFARRITACRGIL